MANPIQIPPDVLRTLFVYDPSSGVLTWLPRDGNTQVNAMWNARMAGRPAGRPHRHGHLYVNIAYPAGNPKNYAVHRVVWAMVYNKWPIRSIDHVNGISSDNRISNLREATQSENMQNARMRKDNTSGVRGVYWVKKSRKWSAFISYDRKVRNLGYFATKEEAIAVRRAAAAKHFGEFARELKHDD